MKFIYRPSIRQSYSTVEFSTQSSEDDQMSSNQTTKWTIDPTHAEVGFSVRHMMIATVRGRFGAVSGTATVDEHNPKNSKVDVTIDARSVDTRQEMRDNHLRSPDFFDV